MSKELRGERERAVELLDLHDHADLLEQELRVRKIVLILTPLVSCVLAAPLLVVLFINGARFFAAYPATFVILLGAILYAVAAERRRLRQERDSIRDRIRQYGGRAVGSDHRARDHPCTAPTTYLPLFTRWSAGRRRDPH